MSVTPISSAMVLNFRGGCCEYNTASEALHPTALLFSLLKNTCSELLMFLRAANYFFWHFKYSSLLPSDSFGITVLYIQCNSINSQCLMLYCIFVIFMIL